MKGKKTALLIALAAVVLAAGLLLWFRCFGDEKDFSQQFPLYYADTPLDSQVKCVRNRPYIPVQVLSERFGLNPEDAAEQLSWPLRTEQDGAYIALSDAVKLCRMGVEFREEDETVRLYALAAPNWTPDAQAPNAIPAYIRLEDIMADYGHNENFTHENLIRVRCFGDYLRDHSDGFYIAWIPLYVNPGENLQNDVSRDDSFYNADFVFTLDCLVEDGGRIGLHGLTHQHGDEVSAEGFEFGDDIPYKRRALRKRFSQAEDICARMGYTCSFFEFPHYAASDLQKQEAEKYFDIIYQQYPNAAQTGRIETRQIGAHTCLWVPTPADYVHSAYDSDGFMEQLKGAYSAGAITSLFIHPAVDYRSIRIRIEGDTMTCFYDESTGILARIIRQVEDWDQRFGLIQ